MIAALSASEIPRYHEIISILALEAELVEPRSQDPRLPRDANDISVLGTFLAAKAGAGFAPRNPREPIPPCYYSVHMATKQDASPSRSKGPRTAMIRRMPRPPGDDVGAAAMAKQVATNLREMRKARGLSLDQLAVASGVSRAALSQIETQRTNPSLGVLWKIAAGLGVHFAELVGVAAQHVAILRRNEAQVLLSSDGTLESRPLTPSGASPWTEAYELNLAAHGRHLSEPHAAGTREVVVVLDGLLRMRVGDEAHDLGKGDAISFLADQPYVYENVGNSNLRCHDIIIYTR
jgi:transcriptional regulator with XRE-family HTH domain